MQVTAGSPHASVGTAAMQGALSGAVSGIVEGKFQSTAEDTRKKAAQFPDLARKAMLGDLRRDLLAALRSALEARGVQVRIADQTRHSPLRLYWPVNSDTGGPQPLPPGQFKDSPPVAADLLVQVAPVAFYGAIGPMQSYQRKVGIAVALFDGRTRRFLGWQAFPFSAGDGHFEYLKYDSLVEDIDHAAPALTAALLSLVPQVAAVIGGGA
jgi:hypothetical protein